eukprot:667679-Rhodomonas_salina.6
MGPAVYKSDADAVLSRPVTARMDVRPAEKRIGRRRKSPQQRASLALCANSQHADALDLRAGKVAAAGAAAAGEGLEGEEAGVGVAEKQRAVIFCAKVPRRLRHSQVGLPVAAQKLPLARAFGPDPLPLYQPPVLVLRTRIRVPDIQDRVQLVSRAVEVVGDSHEVPPSDLKRLDVFHSSCWNLLQLSQRSRALIILIHDAERVITPPAFRVVIVVRDHDHVPLPNQHVRNINRTFGRNRLERFQPRRCSTQRHLRAQHIRSALLAHRITIIARCRNILFLIEVQERLQRISRSHRLPGPLSFQLSPRPCARPIAAWQHEAWWVVVGKVRPRQYKPCSMLRRVDQERRWRGNKTLRAQTHARVAKIHWLSVMGHLERRGRQVLLHLERSDDQTRASVWQRVGELVEHERDPHRRVCRDVARDFVAKTIPLHPFELQRLRRHGPEHKLAVGEDRERRGHARGVVRRRVCIPLPRCLEGERDDIADPRAAEHELADARGCRPEHHSALGIQRGVGVEQQRWLPARGEREGLKRVEHFREGPAALPAVRTLPVEGRKVTVVDLRQPVSDPALPAHQLRISAPVAHTPPTAPSLRARARLRAVCDDNRCGPREQHEVRGSRDKAPDCESTGWDGVLEHPADAGRRKRAGRHLRGAFLRAHDVSASVEQRG